jgi:hypothetical protein
LGRFDELVVGGRRITTRSWISLFAFRRRRGHQAPPRLPELRDPLRDDGAKGGEAAWGAIAAIGTGALMLLRNEPPPPPLWLDEWRPLELLDSQAPALAISPPPARPSAVAVDPKYFAPLALACGSLTATAGVLRSVNGFTSRPAIRCHKGVGGVHELLEELVFRSRTRLDRDPGGLPLQRRLRAALGRSIRRALQPNDRPRLNARLWL